MQLDTRFTHIFIDNNVKTFYNIDDLVKELPESNVVFIYGKSATGKTYLAEKLKAIYRGHLFFHTDDYMSYGFEQSLYALIADIKEIDPARYVVEGVQVPRLIRKGFKPSLLIETYCSDSVRVARYRARGEASKLSRLAGFDAILGKIYAETPPNWPVWRLCSDDLQK